MHTIFPMNVKVKRLKVLMLRKLLLTAGKPERQQFTIRSGVLASISSRQCSTISGRTLPERTDLKPAVDKPT